MKKFFATVLLLSTVAISGVFAQITAQTIFDNFEKATSYRKIENRPYLIELTSDVSDDMVSVTTIISKGENLKRSVNTLSGMEVIVAVINNNKGWQAVMGNEVNELSDDNSNLQSVKDGMDLPMIKYVKQAREAKYIQNQTINGVDCYEVSIINPDNSPGTLYFDAKTSLLIRYKTLSLDEEIIISDVVEYKDFDGIKLPTVVNTNISGTDCGNFTITNVVLDYPTEDWMFEKPE